MAEKTLAEIETRLRDAARQLRETPALEPEARQSLANLIEELAAELHPAEVPAEAAAHLAGSAAHLADTVHQQREPEHVEQARNSLEQAVLAVAARAPVASDLVSRFLAALASIGI
jgi:hypothetical protein